MGIISEGESQFDSSEKKTIDDFVDYLQTNEIQNDNTEIIQAIAEYQQQYGV